MKDRTWRKSFEIGNDMNNEFERKFIGQFFSGDRLQELQKKAVDKGLRGDEVYEFIMLDRKNLSDEIKELRKEVEILRQYGNKDCTAMADEKLKI